MLNGIKLRVISIKLTPKIILDRILLYLVGFMGYWSEKLYDFQVDESPISLTPSLRDDSGKLLLVVGRRHYFETVKDYPVGRLRDVKKIVRNEAWRYPFEGQLQIRVERLSEQSHRVTSWVIKRSVIENLGGKVWFILPESACLEDLAEECVVSLERLNEVLLVSDSFAGLVSGVGRESLFWEANGMRQPELAQNRLAADHVPESQAAGVILFGAAKALRRSSISFYNGPNLLSLLSLPWGAALKLSALLLIVYLSTTSVYIYVAESLARHSVTSIESELEQVVALKNGVSKQQAFLSNIDIKFSNTSPLWAGWSLYLDLKSEGVDVVAVNTTLSTMEFVCFAENGTKVLAFLADDSRVLTADLSTAIREEKGMERFSIKVTFRQPEKFVETDSLLPAIDGALELNVRPVTAADDSSGGGHL